VNNQAIEDLRFLGKRLKGIIELAGELESIQSLDNIIKERESVAQDASEKLLQARKDLVAIEKEKEAHASDITKQEKAFEIKKAEEHKTLLSKESAILSAARDKASSIIQNAEKSYNSVTTSIKDKEAELASLSSAVSLAEEKLLSLNNAIQVLRNQLNG
jgi:chromosome segregation ATPase